MRKTASGKLVSMSNFNGKTVVVTGGTGSFGSTMVRHLLAAGVEEIRIFSRDELKQDLLRRELNDIRAKFVLGDTRDPDSMRHLFFNADFVFHAAALKQVPSGEFFPLEVMKTNVQGSANVIHAAESAGVSSLVVLSTDKAVYPINAMGISKALMEKVAIAEARRLGNSGMRINVTRYGNVMMSRGSVIPAFLDSAKRDGTVAVTSNGMTRFMMSLDESVHLVEHALMSGQQGSTFVRKAPAASMGVLVKALSKFLGRALEVRILGVRHGEKLHETLVSSEEMLQANDSNDYVDIKMDNRGLDYSPYFETGNDLSSFPESYTSNSTRQLDVDELTRLIARQFRGIP